jgi:hypothetical protein
MVRKVHFKIIFYKNWTKQTLSEIKKVKFVSVTKCLEILKIASFRTKFLDFNYVFQIVFENRK